MTPAAGALSLAGTQGYLKHALLTTPGALAIVGANVSIDISGGLVIHPGTGALAIAGTTAALKWTLGVSPGALSLVGSDVHLKHILVVTNGNLVIAGAAVSITNEPLLRLVRTRSLMGIGL
jgi:hypothetical protein